MIRSTVKTIKCDCYVSSGYRRLKTVATMAHTTMIIIYLTIVIVGTQAMRLEPRFENTDEDLSRTEESMALVRTIQRKRSAEGSNSYDVAIEVSSEIKNLNLRKTRSPFSESFQMLDGYHDENGELVLVRREMNEKVRDVYTDQDNHAALLLRDERGSVALEGMLDLNTRIEPLLNDREIRSDEEGAIFHKIYRSVGQSKSKRSCATKKARSLDNKMIELKDEVLTVNERIQRQTTGTTPEVIIMYDNKSTNFFNGDYNKIRDYLAVFWSLVQRPYYKLKTSKVDLQCVGIILMRDLAFQNKCIPPESSPPDSIDSSGGLSALGTCAYTELKPKLSKQNIEFDACLFLTSLDLGEKDEDDGSWSGSTAGIAYNHGVCRNDTDTTTYFGVTMVEDKPSTYTGIFNCAHEMAHLLGATHDGQDDGLETGQPSAKSCPFPAGYVMSYQPGLPTKYYFSKCSDSQINWWATNPGGSCLLNKPKIVAFNKNVPQQPMFTVGVISLDQQCKNSFDSTYTHRPVQPGTDPNEVCYRLWCVSGTTENYKGPALEGSPCGDNMWCIRNECTKRNLTEISTNLE